MQNDMRRVQIGVVGCYATERASIGLGGRELRSIVAELGRHIAAKRAVLIYESSARAVSQLAHEAAEAALAAGGVVVGISPGPPKGFWGSIVIGTGCQGGSLETILALSCDALIVVGGDSSTLRAMTVAFEADIPVVALKGTGGWADQQLQRVEGPLSYVEGPLAYVRETPEEAVETAFASTKYKPEKGYFQ